jgi:hypothetical protein
VTARSARSEPLRERFFPICFAAHGPRLQPRRQLQSQPWSGETGRQRSACKPALEPIGGSNWLGTPEDALAIADASAHRRVEVVERCYRGLAGLLAVA